MYRHVQDADVVVADKGYDSVAVRNWLEHEGIRPAIPTKRTARNPARIDGVEYRRRNIVERTIGWLKENRRIATRFEKLAVNFRAMWLLAATIRGIRS